MLKFTFFAYLSLLLLSCVCFAISSKILAQNNNNNNEGDADGPTVTPKEKKMPIVAFPDAFIVSTGTTIPFSDTDPISQSGQIFFDLHAKKMRIDHNWMGNRRSFIVDLEKKRGFLVTNANCVTSKISGDLLPMGIPPLAVKNAELQLVRHVPVNHYQGFEHSDVASPLSLMQLDFYTRNQNLTVVLDDGTSTGVDYTFPWRSETRRSDRREIAAAPRTRPNWRFFGEEIDEQLVPNFENRVARVLTRDVVVTVDYYDFVPIRPDPSSFEPPGQCKEEVYSETFNHDVDVHEAQRLLTELSFNTEAGQRVLDEIHNQANRRRIADQN